MAEMFIENYAEIRREKSTGARSLARDMALDTLSRVYNGTGITNRALKKPRVQFLYIHHIFRDEQDQLRRLLDKLAESHHFISYSEAVNRILTGAIDKPYISISSDDGLKNNLDAARIMTDYGISACFFICPPMIGEKNYQAIKAFSEQRLHMPAVQFMDWHDVDSLLQMGHEIGAHTMSHVNLAICQETGLQDEIGSCYDAIKSHCGTVEHFAYPYGRFHHFSDLAKRIVFSTGFDSCASAERGCHITTPGARMEKDQLFIRRDHVILSWPLDHILFFMARNVQKAGIHNNGFPYNESSYNNK